MGDSLDPPENAPRAGKAVTGITVSLAAWLKKRAAKPLAQTFPTGTTDLGAFSDMLEAGPLRFVPDLVPLCNETDRKAEK